MLEERRLARERKLLRHQGFSMFELFRKIDEDFGGSVS